MPGLSDEDLKKQYTDRIGATPVGLVKILKQYGDYITVFGFFKFKKYIQKTESWMCVIHDEWGQARVFVNKGEFKKIARMWSEDHAVAFDAVYSRDWNNVPTLRFINTRNPFTFQGKIFTENFNLYKLYWDIKHKGKPRTVNTKVLIKNDLRLLRWALEHSPIYYKEKESFEGRKEKLRATYPTSPYFDYLDRATPTDYHTFYGSPTAQLSRLQDFDLMRCIKGGSGVWIITGKGIRFLLGEVPSPTKMIVINWGEGEREKKPSDEKYVKDLQPFSEEEFKEIQRLAKLKQRELFESGDIYENIDEEMGEEIA
jgi:hypothetical protein